MVKIQQHRADAQGSDSNLEQTIVAAPKEFDLSLVATIGRSFFEGTVPKEFEAVAYRLYDELTRIRAHSERLQNFGNLQGLTVVKWTLIHKYFKYGNPSNQQKELAKLIGGIAYKVFSKKGIATQRIQTELEDFGVELLWEVTRAFRREFCLADNYQPRYQLEHAEYCAYASRYIRRPIRNMQLILRRAEFYIKNKGLLVESAASPGLDGEFDNDEVSTIDTLARKAVLEHSSRSSISGDIENLVSLVVEYLESKNQGDAADLFVLTLRDVPLPEIEILLSLSPRQRDYLQQRLQYHLGKLLQGTGHESDQVREYFGTTERQKFGLPNSLMPDFLKSLSEAEERLLELIGTYPRKEAFKQLRQQLRLSDSAVEKTFRHLHAKALDLRQSNQNS